MEDGSPQPDRSQQSTANPKKEFGWVSIDAETDRGAHGLTPLLLHRLGATVGEVTFAQQLAQKLIDLALGGHFGALGEILTRLDGDAKTCEPVAKSDQAAVKLDAGSARRLLDAISPSDGSSGD